MLLKTASYYVIHICVAAMVAYAVTGNLCRVAHPELAGAHGAGGGLLLP
jgi:uncharacterized membrane protein